MKKSSILSRLINETGFSIMQSILLTVVSNYFLPTVLKLFGLKFALYKQIFIFILCICVILGICYWIYSILYGKKFKIESSSISTILSSSNDFNLDPVKNAKNKKLLKKNNHGDNFLSSSEKNKKKSLSTDLIESSD